MQLALSKSNLLNPLSDFTICASIAEIYAPLLIRDGESAYMSLHHVEGLKQSKLFLAKSIQRSSIIFQFTEAKVRK